MKVLSVSILCGLAVGEAERPITKVVNLLKEMQTQLEADATRDQETYDKLVCWCQSNEKAKKEAIAAADSKITELTEAIQDAAASKASLEVGITQTKKELGEGKNSLAQARADREREEDAWYVDEKNLVQSIAALKNALFMLKGQKGGAALLQVVGAVRTAINSPRVAQLVSVSEENRKAVQSFIETRAAGGNTDMILGIMKSMLEEMEKDLEDGRRGEASAVQGYEELSAAKKAENKAAKKAIGDQKQELADAQVSLEHAKEDLEDTRDSMAADIKFLSDLNLRCQNVDKEFEERVAGRNEELSAVADTIKILTDDDAREVMSRSMSFLEMASRSVRVSQRAARGQAQSVLLQVAASTGSRELLKLASSVENVDFSEVTASFDKMKEKIKQDMIDEVHHKDFCIEDLHENEVDIAHGERKQSDLEKRIDDTTLQIEQLEKEIAEATKSIAETKVEIKKAGMNREAENADFQAELQDARATEAILKKAMTRLQATYGATAEERLAATGASGFMQEPPPPGFAKAEKNKGSTGILSMIESLVEDSKKAAAEAVTAEAQGQSDYEAFVNDSNRGIATLEKEISDNEDARAKAKELKVSLETDFADVTGELERLEKVKGDLHGDCDFLLKNFEARQKAAEDEIEGLEAAKQELQGAGI
jgi:chromosome segregation ATPase